MKKVVYFESLDSLRFSSFLVVFIYHFINYLPFHPKIGSNYLAIHYLNKIGPLGVNFFFVLSGFLITYLLLIEKNNSEKINLKKFYLKRVLRIWPLYYVVLILGFFVYPYLGLGKIDLDGITKHLWKYLFFINNYDRIATGFAGINSNSLGVMWTIAIEEQFYLVWPLVILLVKKERLLLVFVSLIIISVLFRSFYWNNYEVIYFHTLSVFSDLVVGSIIAYGIIYSPKFVTLIKEMPKSTILFIYTLGLFFLFLFVNYNTNQSMIIFSRLIISLFFSFIILEQCFNQSSIVGINRLYLIKKLGIITYGLYCLHLPVIGVFQKINSTFAINTNNDFIFILQGIMALVFSIFVSYISYIFFEKKFLNIKNKMNTIKIE
jgi:peptidoglycan/LPS O-acetylase OafA/YrhL